MRRLLVALIATAALVGLAAETPPALLPAPQQKAACLKSCAGDPRGADGKALLACLTRCDATTDAGVR
jgi:hypothetical protein